MMIHNNHSQQCRGGNEQHDNNNDDDDDDIIGDLDVDEQKYCQPESSSLLLQPPPTMVVGLKNSSGTVCYINTAILLLCYTCPSIIIQYIQSSLDVVLTNKYSNSNNNNNMNDDPDVYRNYQNLSEQYHPQQQQQQQQQKTPSSSSSSLEKEDYNNQESQENLENYEYELILLLYAIMFGSSSSSSRSCCCGCTDGDDVIDPSRFYRALLLWLENNEDACSTTMLLSNIRYTKCGDTILTLIQLLDFIQQKISKRIVDVVTTKEELDKIDLLDRFLHSGQTYTVLTGTTTTTRVNLPNYTTKKSLKTRPLMNPMSMTIQQPQQQQGLDAVLTSCNRLEVFPTLHDVLYDTFCTEQPVTGYTWNNHNDDNNNNNIKPACTTPTITTTTRRLHVLSFPPIFMIHLQRFTIHQDGRLSDNNNNHHQLNNNIDKIHIALSSNDNVTTRLTPIEDRESHILIPIELDMSNYLSLQQPSPLPPKQPENVKCDTTADDKAHVKTLIDANITIVGTTSTTKSSQVVSIAKTNCDNLYHLVGGILHIHDYDGSDADDDDEEGYVGHNVTVVRRHSSEDQYQWYVIDDELVIPVSIDQVVLWLGGGSYNVSSNDHDHYASTQLFARGILLVYDRCHHDETPTPTDLNVYPAFIWNELPIMSRGPVRIVEPKSASRLQRDIALPVSKDSLPGSHGQKHAPPVFSMKSFWLDDSDDDDC